MRLAVLPVGGGDWLSAESCDASPVQTMGFLTLTFSVALGAIHLRGGLVTLLRSQEQLLRAPGTSWVADRTSTQVRGIGLVRLIAAVGLFLPWYANEVLFTPFTFWVLPVFTPVAATLLGGVQLLILLMHHRRDEEEFVPADVGLVALALAVAVLRAVELVIGCWGCAPA